MEINKPHLTHEQTAPSVSSARHDGTPTHGVDQKRVQEVKNETQTRPSFPPKQEPVESTQVKLGEVARHLQQVEKSTPSAPAFDAQKVEQIKKAIQDGQFQVNAKAIADQVIKTSSELIQSQRKSV